MTQAHQSPFESMDPATVLHAGTPVNNTTVTSSEVDMQGYEGCLFLLSLGTIDTTVDMEIDSSSTSGGTLAALTDVDDATADLTQVTATGDNKQYCVDVYRPTNRFLKAKVVVGSGTTGAYLQLTAIRYRAAGLMPVTTSLGELIKAKCN